jgi:hypothetical protein
MAWVPVRWWLWCSVALRAVLAPCGANTRQNWCCVQADLHVPTHLCRFVYLPLFVFKEECAVTTAQGMDVVELCTTHCAHCSAHAALQLAACGGGCGGGFVCMVAIG